MIITVLTIPFCVAQMPLFGPFRKFGFGSYLQSFPGFSYRSTVLNSMKSIGILITVLVD